MRSFFEGHKDSARAACPLPQAKARSVPSKESTHRPTVYLGMSGGVDSSVSAVLLKEQGYNVVGVYMKNWSKDLPGMKCPWAEDLADAKRVAVKLGIDFKVFDFEKDYKQKVVDYMLSEFKKGRTPNPDIMCNQEIKFKLFYEVAREQGADLIATGHYARVGWADTSSEGHPQLLRGRSEEPREDGRDERPEEDCIVPTLLRAVDEDKDQTYFLYRISKEALAHTLFPIGDMKKPDVKKLAEEKGLKNAYKKESMGVCFVGDVGMKDFLREYIEEKPGEIREIETEKVLGFHDGAIFYTIGQRHGLNVGGGLPYYVVKKDLEKNIVYVSKNLNEKNLWTSEIELEDLLIRGELPKSGEIEIRIRHRAPLIPAKFDEGKVILKEKITRPASGQSIVFYLGDTCLGGGIVK